MKRVFAVLLSGIMLVSMLAISAFAGAGNMWGDSLNPEEFFDGNGRGNDSVAVRIVVTGSGKLNKVNFHLACGNDDGAASCDFSVYRWAYNYDYTVSQEPVCKIKIEPGDNSWMWWAKGVELPDGGVSAGEYLLVMDNFQNCAWAIRNNYYGAKAGVKLYENGQPKDGRSIGWQFVFDDDTWYNVDAVFHDEASPTEAPKPTAPASSDDNQGSTDTADIFFTASVAMTVIALAGVCIYTGKKKN